MGDRQTERVFLLLCALLGVCIFSTTFVLQAYGAA